MASGIERLNKLISKDAEKKAEETLEKRYGTYTYDKDAKGFTKTNTAANNNSVADNKSNTNASSSTRNTAKSSSTVSRNASGVERLNKLISSDAEKKAEEKLSKRYGSYSYDKERDGYTKTEVAKAASIPTYTPTADRKSKEEIEALKNRRDEIEKKLKQLNAEYYNYQDNTAENKWMLDDWAEKKGVTALEAELEALEKELEPYKYDDYLENAYDNTFLGRFKANYGQGRLAQDSSAAWNEYLNDPTEENMQKALYIDYVLGQFANNNAETLGEDGWVSKSFAGYAPQLIDQTAASVKGAGVAVGGALALNATGVLAGLPEEIITVPTAIRAGIIGGSGKYSYDTMRGAAFRELIMAGVDENTARAAANDEAVVSALIEMADTGFDIFTLGIGSLIKNVGKFGIKKVTKQLAKEGTEIAVEKTLRRVLSALGKYGLNVAGEGLQEGVQEVISMANEQRALEGETGKLDLIGSAWDKAQNLTDEEAAQVKEAAEEGMKISAMIGGATAATTGITNRAIESRNNRIYSDMGATFSETETVDDVIATGLESAPDTESYKLAEKLQAKREAGETITDREVGRLYAENVKTIREEEAASRKQESKNQPSETVETSDDNFIDEIQKAAQETTQKVAEGSNVLYTASDKFMNETVRAMAEMEQQRNELKLTDAVKRLGDNGAKALGSYYDNQSNFEDYYNGFSRFYEAGSVGLPMDQVNTVYSRNISPAVQQAAYMTGVNDAKASLARDIANQKVYFPEGKLVQNEYSKQLPKSEVSFYSWLSKITGNVTEFVGANMIGGGLADGSYLNGYVSAEIGTEQARKVVISHEITHGFQMTSPVQYRAYRDYAVQIAEKANGSDTSIVEQYRQRYKTTTEKAMDEVAADFTRTLFENRAEMQKFIEANIKDKKSRNMVQKFFDAVHDFIQKIKKALKGNKAKMDEAAINEFGVTVAELEQARELWLNALKSTQENVKNAKQAVAEESSVTSGEDKLRFSLKDSSGKTLTEEQAEFFKDSKVRDENGNLLVVYHGTEKAGFTVFEETDDIGYFFTNSSDIAWTYSGSYDDVKLYKFNSWEEAIKEAKAQGFTLALNENGNYEFDDGWGIVEFEPNELRAFADELAYLIDDNDKGIYKAYLNIKDPLIINGNGSNWDSVIDYEEGMVTWDELSPDVKEAYYDEYGWNIDEKGKGFYGDMPIYLPDANYPYFASAMSTREWVQEAVDGGYDGVIFKNINDEGKHGRGYGNESNVYVVLNSNQIKSVYNENPTDDPDIRYSLKDSKGRELSEEQAEYFKNSKIRDAQGNLKVMYHGTTDDFTVFNPFVKGGKNGTAEGFGIYFADTKEVTDAYGGTTLEGYLNVTKPAASNKKTIKKNDLVKLIKATAQAEAKRFVDEGGYDNVNEALRDTWISNYVDTYGMPLPEAYRQVADSILSMNHDDMNIVQEVMVGLAIRDYEDAYKFYDVLKDTLGIDGFVTEWENKNITSGKAQIVVAFDSNQFKNADNKQPTSNPDIRYSIKKTVESNNNITYDEKTETIAPRFSLKTWNDFDKEKAVKDVVKTLGVSKAKAKEYIDSISSVAKYIADNADRLDYEASENYKALKHNSEYIYTVDMTTLCPKRLLQTGTIDAIQKILVDEVLLGEDYLRIRQMMADKGYEVACGLCYVESRRKELGTMIEKFIKEYNGGNHGFKIPDFATVEGVQRLMVENEKVYKDFIDFNNKRGSGKVNLIETRAEYKNEILKLSEAMVKKLNDRGGLRAQSYSDLETPHLIDMMQVILDMSIKKLMSQAYTKIPNFADAMGNTGMKINMSLIAKGRGYDDAGNLIFDPKEGMPFETAMELRDKYSENVGTILVGINDRHIELAMADDRIDYIIPYHRSGWAMSEYEVLGINGYMDYSDTQNEKWKDPYVRDENGEVVLDKKGKPKKRPVSNIYPSEYWDYSKTGDENAQRYLELCEEQGKTPKFPQFAGKSGYWKLLIDFKMYDNDGVGVPQRAVQPIFDNAVIERILNEYKNDITSSPNKLPVANDVVEEFVAEYKSKSETRLSRKDTSDLLKQNAKLKEYNDYLKEQMKLTKEVKLDKKALEKMARSLIKEYDSNIDATELYDKLNGVYSYLLNTEQPVWEELKSRAIAVARDIVSDATVVNDEMYQQYRELRNYIKKTRFTISDTDKSSLPDGYNAFRKANFGRINLVNDGTPVDVVYQELAAMYPELFDAEEITHPAEQLEHIIEVLESLRPYEENPYSYDMNQAAELVANDIIERYYEVPQVKPTFADKQQQKLEKQKYKGAVKLAELKEKNKGQIEKIKAQSKERAQQILEKERAKKKDAINKLKTHQKEKEAKMSDKRKRSVLRNQIIRHISPMKEKLLRPSDKNHIPQEMRLTVAAVLDAINLESGYTYDPKTGGYRKSDAGLPTRRTQELEKLKKQYQEILGTDSGAEMVIDPSLLGDTAAGIGSNLDKLIDMRDVRLADMTLEQLNTVWEVVRAVEASIIYAGQMLSQQKYETTSSFANAFASDTETRKNRKSIGSKRVSLDLENPYTFFSHFGQAGKDFFRMLRNAQDEAKLIDIELAERMREVVSSEQRKSLEKDLLTFKTVSGDELTLSKAHIMNIYLLSKRPQAEGHLLRGGIVQPEINRKIHRGTDAVQLTAQDLSELFKLLTAEEKKIADGIQKLTLFLAEKGNEATMKVYGYEKFTDPNYWTIKSAKEGVLQTVEEGQDLARSIRNMGSAKQTVPNASNPLEIKSMFEVFDAHASDMITYSVWLAPMEDSTRLFNFRFRDAGENLTGKTMKGLLNRVGGAGSDSYWMNLMRDIQNGISSPADDVMSMVINKTIGNVKKAAVAGNIRVIVQQPTAYLRAMVVLSPADLIAGVVKELSSGVTRNGGWKKAVKYAPIAAIKQAGGFEVSANPAQLSEVLYKPNTKKGKAVQFIKDLPLAGASAADAITWGAIWNACETQVARTQKDLAKDSDSFNKAVKELFTEVIDQSQVVDGVLQRSQIMRSSNALNKQATSYMGEPTTALNMFMRCYDAWVNETSPEKRKAALKNIGRAAVALMASNVVVAIAQSSVDALRDDEEDKEYLERFMTALTGITGDEETLLDIGKNIVLSGNIGNQMNPATYIPYVKDIVSILQGYTVERMDAGVYSDLVSATENVMKSFNGEGKWTKGYAVAKMLTIGAKLFGSSSANVVRDIESIVRSLFIETDDWQALYDMEKQMYDVNKQKSRFLDILYQAMKAGDMDTYNAIVTDLVAAGIKPSDIKNGMSSRAKKDEEVSTEASDFDSTLAGLGLKYNYLEEEEAEEEKFTVDNLSGDEYVRYNEVSTQMLEDIISDLQDYGLGDLDEETANALINAAYNYANNIALEDASDGEYEIDTKWIIGAESAEDDLGLSVAEYIMLKEEYGASALTTEGIFTAYNGGVDPELYLEVKDNINDMKADKDKDGNSISGSKKNKVIEYLNTLGLTEEEYGVLMEAAGYKNPFE